MYRNVATKIHASTVDWFQKNLVLLVNVQCEIPTHTLEQSQCKPGYDWIRSK